MTATTTQETFLRRLTGTEFDDALARIRLERDMAEIEARIARIREERRGQIVTALAAGERLALGAAS